jgi:YfiH family protein
MKAGGSTRLVPEWPAPGRVRVISTMRLGGVSTAPYDSFNLAQHVGDDPAAVAANRKALAEAGGLPAEPLWLNQVHGVQVVTHAGPTAGDFGPPTADASVAFEPGRVCVVMTADCLPVVFTDRAGTRIGVAHAGWRGMVGGVLEATITALGAQPADILAWLGPAISQAAFEVGGEVRDAFLQRSAAHGASFVRNARGRYQADLYALARTTLAEAGVGDVYGGGWCTHRQRAEFFSFRREPQTGRMATLAWVE